MWCAIICGIAAPPVQEVLLSVNCGVLCKADYIVGMLLCIADHTPPMKLELHLAGKMQRAPDAADTCIQ
jgi:hypothetical protein